MSNLGVTLNVALVSRTGPETNAKPERYVQFKEAEIEGHAGCNQFSGSYTLQGSARAAGF